MIVIGEKINGTRKAVGNAIRARDKQLIQDLAKHQVDAGSDFLDVNAGTPRDREPDDMVWLVETIQEVCETPLCLDTANPKALLAGLKQVRFPTMVNSVTGEKPRIDGILPLACEFKTNVILLPIDDGGIPKTSNSRMVIIEELVNLAKGGGLLEEQLYIDPLAIAISTGTEGALVTFDTIRKIREMYPKAHVTIGLSNISFGMPLRSIINQSFLSMLVLSGLDSAIMNPNDRLLKGTMLASEMLVNKDRHCQTFSRAYRSGALNIHEK
ncbi:MAG: dihydropteroate synthase [Proteobacteria bacterium]|nr:dihydropteroate synthase [Pseudomonadota bacterium]